MAAACAAIAALCGSARAGAQAIEAGAPERTPGDSLDSRTAARSEVVLAVTGAIGVELRGTLARLLEAELRRSGFTLVLSEKNEELRAFADGAAQPSTALMGAWLDTRAASGWRLVVIDLARRRAIARDLPGGIEQNAASIEAVVSIVSSAASALGEGLEVASSPIDALVKPEAPRTKPGSRSTEAPEAPASSATEAPRTTAFRAALAATVASLSSDTITTPGVTAALGLSFRSSLELRLTGMQFWPAPIHSEFGDFELSRSALALSAGALLERGAFALVPELGVAGEWLRRGETAPLAGVTAAEDRTTLRVGALIALRGRYLVTRPVSLELALGSSYFGRSVQFRASRPDGSRLATVPPVTLFTGLGLDVAVP